MPPENHEHKMGKFYQRSGSFAEGTGCVCRKCCAQEKTHAFFPLKKIMNIKWESFISDLEVLQKAQVVSVESVVRKKKLMLFFTLQNSQATPFPRAESYHGQVRN